MSKIEQNSQMIETMRGLGKTIAAAYYQIQKARMAAQNQLRDLVRRIKEGIPFDAPEEKKDEKSFDKKYDDKNILPLLEKMLEDKEVTKEQFKVMTRLHTTAGNMVTLERSYKTAMKHYLSEEPLWLEFLIHIKGIGEVLATNLISRLEDCRKFAHVSSLWRYCGLHPVCPNCTEDRKDEEGKTKKVPVVVNRKGICPKCGAKGIGAGRKAGRSIDYSPNLKKLMLGNLVDCLIRTNSPKYREIYDNEKAKQLSVVYPIGELAKRFNGYKKEDTQLSKGHAANRAKRKVAKIFLQHLWEFARIQSGLPVTEPYVGDKMGHEHLITWQDVLKANGVKVSETAA